jgi:hypothetical protein
MELTAAERAQLKLDAPNCYFLRVIGYGASAIVAIPRAHENKPVPGMPGMTVELLHGATLRLHEVTA